jgi:hypothetical protein
MFEMIACSSIVDPSESVYVLGNNSVFKKGAPEQVDVHGGTWKVFWSMIAGEA